MYFIYNTFLSGHWNDLTESIRCYDDGSDAVVIFGGVINQRPLSRVKQDQDIHPDRKVIVYQTEPLVNNHWWKPQQIIEHLKGADEVWDYDLENVAILAQYGFNVKYRPPLYTENLKRIANVSEPEIGLLFYGTVTPYRANFLHDMFSKGWFPDNRIEVADQTSLMMLSSVAGTALDKYIANSKVIINLSPYEGECRQQVTRISYALNNNKCVLSQKSNINYYGDMITEFTDFNDCLAKLLDILHYQSWKSLTVADKFREYSENLMKSIT